MLPSENICTARGWRPLRFSLRTAALLALASLIAHTGLCQTEEPVEVCYDLPNLSIPPVDGQQSVYLSRVVAEGEPGDPHLDRAEFALRACVNFHSPEGFLTNSIRFLLKGDGSEGWEEYLGASFEMIGVEERNMETGELIQRVSRLDQCGALPASTSKTGIGNAGVEEDTFDGIELVVRCTFIDAQSSGVAVQLRFQLMPHRFTMTSGRSLDMVSLPHAIAVQVHVLNWAPMEGTEMSISYALDWAVPTGLWELLNIGLNRRPQHRHYGIRTDAVSDTDVETFWYDGFTFLYVDTRPAQTKPTICPAGILALCQAMRSSYSFDFSESETVGLSFITGWTSQLPTRLSVTQTFDFSSGGESRVDVHAEPAILMQLHKGYLLDSGIPTTIIVWASAAFLLVLIVLFVACCCCCCPCCPFAIDRATKEKLSMNKRYLK